MPCALTGKEFPTSDKPLDEAVLNCINCGSMQNKSDQEIYFLLRTKKLKIQLQVQYLVIYTIKYSNILWKG
jgi:hypothetical protein